MKNIDLFDLHRVLKEIDGACIANIKNDGAIFSLRIQRETSSLEAKFTIKEDVGHCYIQNIRTKSQYRETKCASSLLREVLEVVDKYHMTANLLAAPDRASKGFDLKKLIRWYEKVGFYAQERNPTSWEMYRPASRKRELSL